MRIVRSAVRGLRAMVQGGYGGRRLSWGGYGSQGGIDMRAEAGRRIDNSIVYTAISKTALPLLEADLFVARKGPGGNIVRVENHPIELLLKQPVPWLDEHSTRSLWHMARVLAGNAYSLKHRSGNGRLIGIEYLPLSSCFPVSSPGSGNHVDFYQAGLSGGPRRLAPSDVLHLRWHTIDPWSSAIGLGPLEACLPEIASDNRAARYETAVLRNGGKAHILTPRGLDKNGNPLTWDRSQREQFAQSMNEDATGDMAGSMTVLPYPMEAQEIGWKPSDLMLGDVRDLSEERISACLGLPASWLNLGAGVAQDSNEATRRVVAEQALFDFILPHMAGLCRQLTFNLVPELGEPGDLVTFDRKQISGYRRYLAAQIAAGQQATGGPTMTVNEYRTQVLDMDPIDGGDELRTGAPSDSPGDGANGSAGEPARRGR